MIEFVIYNKDEDAYWSNADGWVELESADTFSFGDTGRLALPVGGKWVDKSSLNFAAKELAVLQPIIEKMRQIGCNKLYAEAEGAGDEGNIECLELFKDGVAFEVLADDVVSTSTNKLSLSRTLYNEFLDLIDNALEVHDYNYYDGLGGKVELTIDLTTNKVNWVDLFREELLQEDGNYEIKI